MKEGRGKGGSRVVVRSTIVNVSPRKGMHENNYLLPMRIIIIINIITRQKRET